MSIIPLQRRHSNTAHNCGFRQQTSHTAEVFAHHQTSHTAEIFGRQQTSYAAGNFGHQQQEHNSISGIIIPKAPLCFINYSEHYQLLSTHINSYQLLSTLINSYQLLSTRINYSKHYQLTYLTSPHFYQLLSTLSTHLFDRRGGRGVFATTWHCRQVSHQFSRRIVSTQK